MVGVAELGEGGGLPAEGGELACAGDRDHAGGLGARAAQHRPALMQPALCAPRNFDHARVLAVLAAGEVLAPRGVVAVVVSGFDQQPAPVS